MCVCNLSYDCKNDHNVNADAATCTSPMKGGARGIGTETEDAEDRDERFRADGVDVEIQGVVTAARSNNNSGHVWRYRRRQSC